MIFVRINMLLPGIKTKQANVLSAAKLVNNYQAAEQSRVL